MAPNTLPEMNGPELTPALRRKNLRTGAAIVALMLVMMALSYFGRELMVPVLFKT